ncbi:virulence protein E [Marinifilum sp. N1E240]|uniref:BT4734/BF3469 family protein n=1 Tax=Marinifilum sp. N1E240 TaxID=2608082 RepID=UPI00128CA299|nr:BT4734/BF3469 family protein [Marinifilum sp. N1E240]MPQ48960.1 virulence protein E [Marinifilum sp. N1E240]
MTPNLSGKINGYLDTGYLDNQIKIKLPEFSFFKKPISNTKPYRTISVLDAYTLIKGHWNIERTQALRQIKDVEEARAFKASQFNYVCFSGVFTKRSEKHFQHHSGLMVLDFDHLSDVDGVKNSLLADESLETVLLFRSPSGDGLKWVITIDIRLMDHKNYFKAVGNYLKQTYQFEVDASGKDVARACFLPYDPQVYINPNYLSHEKGI